MKRMFTIIAASMLAACAAQPERVQPQNAMQQSDARENTAVATAAPKTTQRVYLDDYDLLHVKSVPAKRQPLVLGSGNR